jgi:hypothetical protein
VPLTLGRTYVRYKPFIDARIFTEAELEEIEPAPDRKGKSHGMWCNCTACEAAFCIVGGEIVHLREHRTKTKRELMAFLDLSYGLNSYSVVLFPWVYNNFIDLLGRPTMFLISGKKGRKNTIVATEVVDVVEVAEAVGWQPEKVIDISKGRQIKMRKKRAA